MCSRVAVKVMQTSCLTEVWCSTKSKWWRYTVETQKSLNVVLYFFVWHFLSWLLLRFKLSWAFMTSVRLCSISAVSWSIWQWLKRKFTGSGVGFHQRTNPEHETRLCIVTSSKMVILALSVCLSIKQQDISSRLRVYSHASVSAWLSLGTVLWTNANISMFYLHAASDNTNILMVSRFNNFSLVGTRLTFVNLH